MIPCAASSTIQIVARGDRSDGIHLAEMRAVSGVILEIL
jgi:hypothetical protein